MDQFSPVLQSFGAVVDVSLGEDPLFQTMLVQERMHDQRWWLLYLCDEGDCRLIYAFWSLRLELGPTFDAM